MSWLWHSISEGRTTPGGAVSAVVEDDGFISLFVADPASGVYTARGSLGRTAAPLSNDLGDALTGDISVPGGEARLFERGATLTSSAGEALVSFALPSIGVPSIATGEAASAAVLDPGAITCQTRGWDVDQCVVALRALFADRLALLPTGKPSSSVPLTLGAPVEVGVWGMWSSVSQGGTVPGAPVSAVLGQDGLISLFVADPARTGDPKSHRLTHDKSTAPVGSRREVADSCRWGQRSVPSASVRSRLRFAEMKRRRSTGLSNSRSVATISTT